MEAEAERQEAWRQVEKKELTEGNMEVGMKRRDDVAGRSLDAEADSARDDGGWREVHLPLRLGER